MTSSSNPRSGSLLNVGMLGRPIAMCSVSNQLHSPNKSGFHNHMLVSSDVVLVHYLNGDDNLVLDGTETFNQCNGFRIFPE